MNYANEEKIINTHINLSDHALGGVVGAVVGAATGAAAVVAVQGATLGTIAGLPGMAAGVAIGGVVGALAGKEAAEILSPYEEDTLWRHHYENCFYFDITVPYEHYAPAYQYGMAAASIYKGRPFEEIEIQLAQGWEFAKDNSPLAWHVAKYAARDAYEGLPPRDD